MDWRRMRLIQGINFRLDQGAADDIQKITISHMISWKSQIMIFDTVSFSKKLRAWYLIRRHLKKNQWKRDMMICWYAFFSLRWYGDIVISYHENYPFHFMLRTHSTHSLRTVLSPDALNREWTINCWNKSIRKFSI